MKPVLNLFGLAFCSGTKPGAWYQVRHWFNLKNGFAFIRYILLSQNNVWLCREAVYDIHHNHIMRGILLIYIYLLAQIESSV